MFHTLSELYEKEKNKGKQKPKKSILNMSKERSPHDNYYGKGNKAYDHYNKRPSESLNEKFEKTKNKIKLIVFKNGFILNNGPFRDRSIPENNQFMEEVERGNIPHELLNKGINDLGILLINRKKEIYYQPIIPNNNLIQITQINQVNPIKINPIDSINNNNNSYNAYNQFINFDFNQFNNNQYSPKNSFNKPNNNNNLFNNNNLKQSNSGYFYKYNNKINPLLFHQDELNNYDNEEDEDLSSSNSSTSNSEKRKFSDNLDLILNDDHNALNKKIQESVDKMFEHYKYSSKNNEEFNMIIYYGSNKCSFSEDFYF